MWQVDSSVPSPPFTVTVNVCGKPLCMEMDTGATVSVMSKKRFQELLPAVPVKPSMVLLRSYSGELTPVQGKIDARVQFQDKEAVLPLFLTGDGSPTLLGRNWIRELGINFSEVEATVHSLSDVETLVHEFSEVFEESLGTFKGREATIHVPQDAPTKFFKPRPLPFCLEGWGYTRAPAPTKRGCHSTSKDFKLGCAHCSCGQEGWPCEDLR